MRTQRWIAAAAVGAVTLATGLVVTGAGRAEALEVATGFGEGDGLRRWLVTLDEPTTALMLGASEPTTVEPQATGDQAPASSASALPSLDLELLDRAHEQLGPDGHLEWRSDGGWYVTEAGAARVTADSTATPDRAPDTAPDTAPDEVAAETTDGGAVRTADEAPLPMPVATDPIAELEAQPGVASAQLVGEDRVLLAADLSATQVLTLPGVETVEHSPQVPVAAVVDDPYYDSYGWNLHNTGSNAYGQTAVAGADVAAPEGWAASLGEGTVVAVVDTGYDHDHPELADALWTNPTEACGAGDTNGNGLVGDCHGWNFYADSPDVDNGAAGTHGTSVSGTVAAALGNGEGSAGLAPGALIMPLVVGGGENVDVLLAAEAFRYAADNGADVINASFGGSMTGYALDQLSAAVDYAVAKGVLVVVAAGNDSADRDSVPVYPASLPQDGIVTVGSSTAADAVADHSAYGATTVDLFAPGYYTVVPWNDGSYRLVSGTSFASPHVAAAAALYRSVAPELSVAELKAAILDDADRLPAFTGRSVSGGRLDVSHVVELSSQTSYTFAGTTSTTGDLSPTVAITSRAGAGHYRLEVGLGMLDVGEVWALSGQQLEMAGQVLTTDDTGTVSVDLGQLDSPDGLELQLLTTAWPGAYALTVQLEVDGEPVGGRWAAPLVVVGEDDPAVDDGEGSDGGSDGSGDGSDDGSGGSSDGGSSDGGSSDGGSSDGGSSDGGSSDGGSSDGGSSDGGSSDQGSSDGGSSDGGAGDDGSDAVGGSDPADGGSSDGGASDGGSDDGAGDSGSGGSAPDGSAGGGSDASDGSDSSDGSEPGAPDVAYFDRVGDFKVTSLTPAHVASWGGDLVTVHGSGLSDVSVLVGGTRRATVLWSAGSFVMFITPAAGVGSHDVLISGGSRTSLLPDALVYVDLLAEGGGSGASGGGSGGGSGSDSDGASGSDGTDGGSGGGTTDPGDSTGDEGSDASGGGSAPDADDGGDAGDGDQASGGSGDGSDGGAGDGVDAPAEEPGPTGPVVRIGPHGERLVRDAAFAGLGQLWSLSCEEGCSGVRM